MTTWSHLQTVKVSFPSIQPRVQLATILSMAPLFELFLAKMPPMFFMQLASWWQLAAVNPDLFVLKSSNCVFLSLKESSVSTAFSGEGYWFSLQYSYESIAWKMTESSPHLWLSPSNTSIKYRFRMFIFSDAVSCWGLLFLPVLYTLRRVHFTSLILFQVDILIMICS